MSEIELMTVTLDDFAGRAHHDGGRSITILLTGSADHGAVESLENLLTLVHERALELGVREAVVDLRALEFMNSSCFKSFVYWITQIRELEASRRYTLRFLSDPNMHWQKRSLRTLSCFATDLVSVE